MKRKYVIFAISSFIFIVIFLLLILKTGFLQKNQLDNKDLEYWDYENGFIKNTSEIEINGNSNVCWILIHSYTSTPLEMRELGEKINSEFNDSIFAIRLRGHGEIPSHVVNLNLNDWYSQINDKFDKLNSECNKINVVGSSFGSSLAMKLSEEKEFNNLYILGGYLKLPYKWYYVLDPNIIIKLSANMVYYTKNVKISSINSPEGRQKYVGYWNFPLLPVKNSQEFLKIVKNNLDKINENLLIQHSINDDIASLKEMQNLLTKASSGSKEIILFERSDHILLMDYDSDQVIDNIIEFEKRNR